MNLARRAVIVGSLFLVGVLAVPVSRAIAADETDIAQKVQAAKTPADHEAIAKYYDGQAAEARKKAAEHKRMGDSYRGSSTGKAGSPSSMPYHCDALSKAFESQAAEYEGMAQTHRDLAKAVK
jgi:hypothetical protein